MTMKENRRNKVKWNRMDEILLFFPSCLFKWIFMFNLFRLKIDFLIQWFKIKFQVRYSLNQKTNSGNLFLLGRWTSLLRCRDHHEIVSIDCVKCFMPYLVEPVSVLTPLSHLVMTPGSFLYFYVCTNWKICWNHDC